MKLKLISELEGHICLLLQWPVMAAKIRSLLFDSLPVKVIIHFSFKSIFIETWLASFPTKDRLCHCYWRLNLAKVHSQSLRVVQINLVHFASRFLSGKVHSVNSKKSRCQHKDNKQRWSVFGKEKFGFLEKEFP